MSYRIAGIDVHKKMLAVAVADVEVDGDFQFERQKVGTTPIDLRRLADWLVEHEVDEVVTESTAQYWRPVWEALEEHWRPRRRARESAPRLAGTLHLAQAQSNRGPGGRKRDFPDAERLVKRLVALRDSSVIDAIIDRFELLAKQLRMGRFRPEFGSAFGHSLSRIASSTIDTTRTSGSRESPRPARSGRRVV